MKKDVYSRIFRTRSLARGQSLAYSLLMVSFFLLSFGLSAQERVIQGSVYEASSNEPLIGVSVLVKGSTIGTITDFDGNYSLTATGESTLVFSYMGYKTQEIVVGSQSVINVKMSEDTEVLEEVVVVGFGTQKKVNLTGSVGVAKAEELQSRPVTNATQALQGLVTGLQITQSSGSLDKTPTMNIRGTATIGEGSSGSPLVLIDGMEGDLNTINPQDIESVSVLKDAAASSIYGSRAPFGVILVTTKSGKTGRMTVNYNNNFRWGTPTVKMHQMDSESFMYYYNEANRNTSNGTANFFSDEMIQKVRDYRAGLIAGPITLPESGTQWQDVMTGSYADTDWYDVIYKDFNFSQEHNLSASGGGEKLTYYLSLNYMDQQGLLKLGEEGLKRYNVAAKISAQPARWVRFNYSSRFIRSDYNKPSAFNDGLYENLARQNWPNMSLYDNNNHLMGGMPGRDLVMGGDYNQVKDALFQQLNLDIEPIKDLHIIGDFNYRIDSEDTDASYLKCYNHDINGNPVNVESAGNSVSRSRYRAHYMNANIRAGYARTFAEFHHLSAMVGAQVEDFKYDKYGLTGYGLVTEDIPYPDLITNLSGTSEKYPSVWGSAEDWAQAGFFGRVNYDYKERYLLEANLRYDGSSRYRAEKRWAYFPSVSAGWNIAREEWMAPVEATVNTLKLRASFGELGNSNTNGNYPTYLTLEPHVRSGKWLQDGKQPTTVGTPDPLSTYITWETIRTWDVGIDWGFFNSRLTGSFDYYERYTLDMMNKATELPGVYGAVGDHLPKVNSGNLRTFGWEFEIQWKDRLSNGLDYSVKFLLSDAQSMITRYPNNPTKSLDKNKYIEGELLGNIYGYTTLGIAQSNEQMQAHLDQLDANYTATHGQAPIQAGQGQAAQGSNWAAGDIMYADLNGDGVVNTGDNTLDNHGDLTIIGNNTPRFQFGIDLNAAWKGFDLRLFFQGVMKRDYWQGLAYFWGAYTDAYWSIALEDHLDFWRDENSYVVQAGFMNPNTDAYYPRPSFDSDKQYGRNHHTQTKYLQDASYIRLKNVQLGYTLPAKLTQKAGMQSVRVYFSGENLWTGTKLAKMFDPETVDGGNNNEDNDWRMRKNGNAYPLSRSFSCGLSITF